MEKRTNIGIKGQDFFGHCPQCLTSCDEEIRSLIHSFPRGVVVERSGYSLDSAGPNSVTGGAGIRINYIDRGNVMLAPARAANSGKETGARGDPMVSDYEGTWLWRSISEALAYFSKPENADKVNCGGAGEIVLDADGNPINRGTSLPTAFGIASDVYYNKRSDFVWFPVCGDLEVYDSGSTPWQHKTEYVKPGGGLGPGFGGMGGMGGMTGGMGIKTNGETFFVFLKSACSDTSASRRSQHPHMVGVQDGLLRSVGSARTGWPSKYNRGRKFDNHEEVKKVGLYRLTATEKLGRVNTYIMCDPNNCGSPPEYVGFGNSQNPCTFAPHPTIPWLTVRTCKYPDGMLPAVPCGLVVKYRASCIGYRCENGDVVGEVANSIQGTFFDTYNEALDALIDYGNRQVAPLNRSPPVLWNSFGNLVPQCGFNIEGLGRLEVPEVWKEAWREYPPCDYYTYPPICPPPIDHPRTLVSAAYWSGWGSRIIDLGFGGRYGGGGGHAAKSALGRDGVIGGIDSSASLNGFQITTKDDSLDLTKSSPVEISGGAVIGVQYYEADLSYRSDGAAINKDWYLNFGSPIYERALEFLGAYQSIPPFDISITLK